MSCHNEHVAHGGHDHHDHGHDDHDHDHSDDITPALQRSLYQHIQIDKIRTLNESVRDSGMAVVKKTWAERLEVEPEVESDTDEQLLMHIPFTGQIKLHSILLRSSNSPSAPRTLKVFVDRDDLDFGSTDDAQATQEFELSQTSEVQEIPVKRVLFSKARHLTLFFVDNFGVDEDDDQVTRLSYLGFKGDWMQLGRAPTNILYEAAPNPSDHAVHSTWMEKNSFRHGI